MKNWFKRNFLGLNKSGNLGDVLLTIAFWLVVAYGVFFVYGDLGRYLMQIHWKYLIYYEIIPLALLIGGVVYIIVRNLIDIRKQIKAGFWK